MISIHCALEDLAKLETGGYYADCALAEKAPQVINVNPDEGDGGGDDDGHRGGGKDYGVDADSALAVEESRMLHDNRANCRTGCTFSHLSRLFLLFFPIYQAENAADAARLWTVSLKQVALTN